MTSSHTPALDMSKGGSTAVCAGSPGTFVDADEWNSMDPVAKEGFTPNDRRDMQRMGKKQEFRRNFRFITTVGFTCCVMGTWEILMTSNTQALTAGGSAGLFWSLCWSYTGQTFIVLSLAEMASMAPTAGEFSLAKWRTLSLFPVSKFYKQIADPFAPQIRWTVPLGIGVRPSKRSKTAELPLWYKRFSKDFARMPAHISVGWLSTISWQSIVALDCYLVGTVVQSLIIINDDSYTATSWQATLLIFASVIGIGVFNIFGVKHLPLAEGIFVAGHFFAFFPVTIIILVLAPKTSPSAVFLTFTDNGAGWPNVAWATLVGQVSAMFSVLGSDSVAHMAEEVEEAGRIVPRSMVWSFFLNVPFTFAMVISYLFCIPSVTDALNDPTGYPFIYVFRQATGSRGGTTGMTVVVLLLLIMITISSMASTSRQTFAFARDNGLPFSSWLGAVHRSWHVPLNSIIFTMAFTAIISLINIGSTAAFNAMLSLSTVALMATYLVSITCVLIRRIRKQHLPPARWSLGHAGLPINACALCYACWSFFWSFWPNAYDVNAENFNWACVLFIGLMSVGSVLYFTHARKVYDGPVTIVEGEGRLH